MANSVPLTEIEHAVDAPLRIGVVVVEGLSTDRYPESFDTLLESVMEGRREELTEEDDAWRMAVRDVFRNGRYKPTGRGKPASEYLLGAARKDAFPRINSIVDVCNLVSLSFILPISVCDLDRAGSSEYLVRLGSAGESYVFNSAGQEIDLEDLIVGCVVDGEGNSTPIINAVKDCMATKTTPDSSRVMALLYAPLEDPFDRLGNAVEMFSHLASGCGSDVEFAAAVLMPGEAVELRPGAADS